MKMEGLWKWKVYENILITMSGKFLNVLAMKSFIITIYLNVIVNSLNIFFLFMKLFLQVNRDLPFFKIWISHSNACQSVQPLYPGEIGNGLS